jgi:hypothetical protein
MEWTEKQITITKFFQPKPTVVPFVRFELTSPVFFSYFDIIIIIIIIIIMYLN